MPEAGSGELELSWISAYDPNFAVLADELVNVSLGRTSVGSSVIDPTSVLGESGRLYHGYKDGKYFSPNDAVYVRHFPK